MINFIEEKPWCDFYNEPCRKPNCLVYQDKRPMIKEEIERRNAADIPITDPYIHSWCTKYNRQVESGYIPVDDQEKET